MTPLRLDTWLVAHGHAPSRQRAQALVMAGRVFIDGAPATKSGASVKGRPSVRVEPVPFQVSRGATKLAAALDAFGLNPSGRIALDVGASTGGFTQTLLERGALRVYAIDVGRGQLHDRLRRDPRVILCERVNARALSSRDVPEACGFATIDVSFISALKILPALPPLLVPGSDVVVLVKPQFEVGRTQVGRGGVVRDPALHLQALRGVASGAQDLGYAVRGAHASPITGVAGNREFFVHLRHGEAPLGREEFDALTNAAVNR